MRVIFYLFLFISFALAKPNIFLSHTNVVKGTTFAVIFQSDTKLKLAPNVIFKNKTYQMFSQNNFSKDYELFLPINYNSKLQKEHIQVKYKHNNKTIKKNLFFNIIQGNYKKNEIIKVAKGKVTLSNKSKKRAAKEYSKVFKNVYSVVTSTNYINKSLFQNPMDSKITSAFGTARIYNGKRKNYHSGTDFRAKMNTPIYASNDGVIALTMNRFYLGNVVYINHGRGAYSYYCHMSKIKVKRNQTIKKGDLIGYSGKTGRVTGPHLHYAFRLYNTTVDPMQFAALHNKILKQYH